MVYGLTATEAERQWQAVAKDQISLLERQLDRAIGWLEAAHGLFQASTKVTPDEFDAFVAALGIDDRIRALSWVPRVTRDERQTFVEEHRTYTKQPFQITQRDAAGKLVPRVVAGEYFPVAFIYPLAGNEGAVGYDIGSNASRLKAINRAIQSNQTTSTARINLVQDAEKSFGFLVILPFFKQPSSAPAIAIGQRPQGLLTGVLKVDELVKKLVIDANLDADVGVFKFDIFDMTSSSGEQRLFPTGSGETVAARSSLSIFRDIDVANRKWRVYVSSTAVPITLVRLLPAALAFLFGMAVTALAFSQHQLARRKSFEAETARLQNVQLTRARDEADAQKALVITRQKELSAAHEQIKQKVGELESLSDKLSRYLPQQLYELIFTGEKDAKAVSERKKLTIFFSDLVGFADAADRMESEDLTHLMNEYLTEMSEIAALHGGTVDKFMGDGILIFFGDHASKGVSEDAIACARMAFEMRARLAELNHKWHASGITVPMNCRMGISTGYCAVGNFGSATRLDYTVIGTTVNLAGRLERIAEPGEIVMSEETYLQVRAFFDCESIGSISVPGFANKVTAYRVLGAKARNDNFVHETHVKLPHMALDLDTHGMSDEELRAARAELEKAWKILEKDRKA